MSALEKEQIDMSLTGGQAIVKSLEAFGIDTTYCLAGESFLPTIEALRDSGIRTITSRLEIETGFAALAHGSLTNTPGVALVTRGPGASNLSISIHTAQQSSIPLVALIGQVPSTAMEYEATQKIDYKEMFGSIAKGVFTPRTPQEMADFVMEALELSVSGRPGPVVVDMPIDILKQEADVNVPTPQVEELLKPSEACIKVIIGLIKEAKHPVIIAGERLGFENATDELSAFAKKANAGVLTAMRQQDLIPFDHECHLGSLGLGQPPHVIKALDEADLVINLGHRMNQETTRLFDKNLLKGKKFVSIYPDKETVEHPLYKADVKSISHIKPTLEALINSDLETGENSWVEGIHQEQINFMTSPEGVSKADVDMAEVVKVVNEVFPEDGIIITDAGNFATWPQVGYKFRSPHTQLGPINGAMGYAGPAALAAKIVHPNKKALAFVGDGGFLMTGPAALATAIHEDLPIIMIVCDNSHYGTIFMHHARAGNKDNYTLGLTNPDFAALASSYEGVKSFTVNKTEEFEAALKEALAHNGSSLLHLKTDISDIAAGKTLDQIQG